MSGSASTDGITVSSGLVMHPCAVVGCEMLAVERTCQRHVTADDRRRMRELDEARNEVIRLEEAWQAARRRLAEEEAAAGIERESPSAGHPTGLLSIVADKKTLRRGGNRPEHGIKE